MTFNVGDRVRATSIIEDRTWTGKLVVPVGTPGVVVRVIPEAALYPITVRFAEIQVVSDGVVSLATGTDINIIVDSNEIEMDWSSTCEPASKLSIWGKLRNWWNSLPVRDAETEFGNEETVAAFKAVQQER